MNGQLPVGIDGHLYLLAEASVDRFAERYGGDALLTREERLRMARQRTEAARRRFLGARLLSRHALSDRDGRPVGEWRFRTSPAGRPEPEPDGHALRFNLSHTDGLVACLVTEGGSCGVDVERTPARPDAVTHLPRWFAPAERGELSHLTAGLATGVAAYWVLKEAYLKAIGTGLRRELDGFAFSAPWRAPIRLTDPTLPAGEASRWRFELVNPAPGFVLAAVVENGVAGRLHRTWVS
ncbi:MULTISPECIES: 4'-phosphopantetheinyl transferase superfamily protein [unclassified Kitasatospora]|uniref:4'-phosphopantetheinyl transferase family protein n=1 Tax=unclassified Kitasatospora TaxID=2633591 RepID=UPI000711061D|nr:MULTISPECIES: 4'-phosphopantetheinyl transferase superfamily protein [unclassified Kitasatospora]KQV19134.1 4-phosphopantetheinyl transferase [Kitasatospora sp. Root107]KRB75615.1 4-phosphopantetheinyl transferase [Kitasatospora sp. Root187]